MIEFEAIIHNDKVCHLSFAKDYYLHMCLIRIQEFYESKDDSIRNKIVNLEDIMDSYFEQFGKFDYLERWAAFNIPGNVLKKFKKQAKDIRYKEQLLLDAIDELCPDWENHYKDFYLICTFKNQYEKSDTDHEIAHALFYIDKAYRKEAIQLVEMCSCKKSISNKLRKWGYTDGVLTDEIQAYLATSSDDYLTHEFKLRKSHDTSKPFKKLFVKHKGDLCQ